MFRLFLLLHRCLGIGIGLLVALWCLSGFVMMYVQYPELSDREYLAGLPALDTADCCIANPEVLAQLDGVDEVRIEMLAGLPVLRARFGRDISILVNLITGWWFTGVNQETAMQQADAYLQASGSTGEARFIARHGRDQWTVADDFNAYRPLYKFAADDAAGTHVYVSGVNAQIVQTTTTRERFWNWLGSVPHWLYPTALRQNTALWAEVVIWLTIASLFLVVVGMYLGIRQYGTREDGSRSPYQGLNLWHHYSGLVFGVLTLTWLFSGLLSMNPWGALTGDSAYAERQRLQGSTLSAAELTTIVDTLGDVALPERTVQLRSVPLAGRVAMLATDAAGDSTRLDGRTLQAAPLPELIWTSVAELTGPGRPVRHAGFIDAADAYYFSHHEPVTLPVYRIVFDDEEQTRYYFDAVSAELLQKTDSERRISRWLFLGLHRGDFVAWMRRRPVWDLIMLPLMFGVTLVASAGVCLGYRRLTR